MPRFVLLGLCSLVLLLACQACDNTLYVSSTGDDTNNGSSSSPFLTFSAAISQLCDNGTIIFSSGSYPVAAASRIYNAKGSGDSTATKISLTTSGSTASWEGVTFLSAALSDSVVTFSHCIFRDRNSSALTASNSNVTIYSTEFSRNYGGVVATNSRIYVYDSVFRNNQGMRAITIVDSIPTEALLISNSVQVLHVSNSTFVNNTANQQDCAWASLATPCGGGAIYVKGGSVRILSSTFQKNHIVYDPTYWTFAPRRLAQSSGGGILLHSVRNNYIDGCVFEENYAGYSNNLTAFNAAGSALRAFKVGRLYIARSNFTNNGNRDFFRSSLVTAEISTSVVRTLPKVFGSLEYGISIVESTISNPDGLYYNFSNPIVILAGQFDVLVRDTVFQDLTTLVTTGTIINVNSPVYLNLTGVVMRRVVAFRPNTPVNAFYLSNSVFDNCGFRYLFQLVQNPFSPEEPILNFNNNTFINNVALESTSYFFDLVAVGIVNFNNNTFINNSATGVALIRVASGKESTLAIGTSSFTNCTFIGNQGSGTIFIADTDVNFRGCVFESNTAQFGAAIFSTVLDIPGVVAVIDSTFVNNRATDGGAISVRDDLNTRTPFSITNSRFSRNIASRLGGAVYLSEVMVQLSGSTFDNNNAVSGAALSVVNANLANFTFAVVNSQFSSNRASSFGGDIYFETTTEASAMTVLGCAFGGSAAVDGGAVYQTSVAAVKTTPTIVSYESSVFTSVTATNGGAIYASPYMHTILQNITCSSASASYGSLIYGLESRIDIYDSLVENSAVLFEGSVYMKIASAIITAGIWNNLVFRGNNAERFIGGAVSASLHPSAPLTISNSKFIANSGYYGGAISAVADCHIQMSSCEFSGNQATQGGAMYLVDRVQVVMSNCSFTANSATTGAVYVDNSALIDIANSTFVKNVAAISGGALAIVKSAVVAIEDSLFKQNSASTSHGGALYMIDSAKVQLINNAFQENDASSGQGGAFLTSSTAVGYPIVSGCLFEKNAAISGAAMAVGLPGNYTGFSPAVSGCTFVSNSATQNGGAMYLTPQSFVELPSCTFKNNTSVRGGALYTASTLDGYPRVINGTFIENSAVQGGSLYVFAGSPKFSGCTFALGAARSDGTNLPPSGGSVYTASASRPLFINSAWTNNNAAASGGAVLCGETSRPVFASCQFTNNNASNGGAIASDGASFLAVNASTFTSNAAAAYGGSLYVKPKSLSVQNSVFVKNNANYGGAINFVVGMNAAASTFKDNSFSHNFANSAGGVYFWGFNTAADVPTSFPTCSNCAVLNNTAGSYGSDYATKAYEQRFNYTTNSTHTTRSTRSASALTSIEVSNNIVPSVVIEVFDAYGNRARTSDEALLADVALVLPANAQMFVGEKDPSFSGEIVFKDITLNGNFDHMYMLEFSLVSSSTSFVVPPIRLNVTLKGCGAGEEQYTSGSYDMCRDCAQGYYNFNGNGKCLQCPEHATCPGGALVLSNEDYYMYDDGNKAYMYLCAPGVCKANNLCGDHRSGPLCGKCEEGFQDLNGVCITCTESDPASLFGTLILLWAFITFLQITNKEPTSGNGKKKYMVSGLTKIIVFYIQTVSMVGSPHQTIRKVFSFLSFQFFLGIADKCSLKVSFFEDFLVTILIPVMLFVLLIVNYFAHQLILLVVKFTRPGRAASTKQVGWMAFIKMDFNLYIKTTCALLLFSYTSVTQGVFTFLNCRDVGPYSLVASAPSVSCNSDEYHKWSILAYFLLAGFVVLMPVMLFFFLFYHFRKGNLILDSFIARTGVLFQCFKPGVFFWEVVILLRRMLYVVIWVVAYTVIDVRNITMFFFTCFILSLHIVVQPYRSKSENYIESILLATLMVLSAIESSNAKLLHSDDMSVVSSIITFLAVIPIVFGLWKVLVDFLYRIGWVKNRNSKIQKMVFGSNGAQSMGSVSSLNIGMHAYPTSGNQSPN